MKLLKIAAFGLLAATVTACTTVDTVSRNAPLEVGRVATQEVAPVQRNYDLQSIRFVVPENLTVSEANSYYPIADIVWRGDPMGDRPEQIATIFNAAAQNAVSNLNGAVPVIVDVQLARFHSLTERTRYSIGGVHSIKFDMTVRHATTGAILEPARRINGDFEGLGGSAAIAADSQGQTQRVRITDHLSSLFLRELSGTVGNVNNAGANS